MRPEVGVAASITASSRSFLIRTPSSDPLAFRVLAWCTVALAIGLLTASVLANPDALSIRPAAFAGWTAMVVLASASSVTLGHDIRQTICSCWPQGVELVSLSSVKIRRATSKTGSTASQHDLVMRAEG